MGSFVGVLYYSLGSSPEFGLYSMPQCGYTIAELIEDLFGSNLLTVYLVTHGFTLQLSDHQPESIP